MKKIPIYPFRVPMKHRNETGFCLTERQPSTTALVVLRDHEYGFMLYDYERVTRNCREKAIVVRDHYISSRCSVSEQLFLGDLDVTADRARLRFEFEPLAILALKELLWRTFGSYHPLHAEADRVYVHNPNVFFGDDYLGSLKEIVDELSGLDAKTVQ